MYGKRKPLARCRPLSVSEEKKSRGRNVSDLGPILSSIEENADQLTTPTVTEGENATDLSLRRSAKATLLPKTRNEFINLYALNDLHMKYFRQDVVGLHIIDPFRFSDTMLVLLMGYVIFVSSLPTSLMLHFAHACARCIFHSSVWDCLAHVVPLCLDSDPYLTPLSCGGTQEPTDADADSSAARDGDDFSFWSEQRAKRICSVIEQAFGVEYGPEVVMADANLTALANQILDSKQMLVR